MVCGRVEVSGGEAEKLVVTKDARFRVGGGQDFGLEDVKGR